MEKYPTYLIHFNKNHSSKTGQFTFGDGDGDNIRDDHHNYAKNKGDLADAPQGTVTSGQVKTVAKILAIPGKWIAGKLFAQTQAGQFVNNVKSLVNYGNNNLGWKNFTKGSNWENYKAEQRAKIRENKDKLMDPLYEKAANFINKYI